MELYFGEFKVPSLLYYSADRDCRNTKKEYNANGDMLIDLVSRKLTLTVWLGRLTAEQMEKLQAETMAVFFPVTFFDPLKGETVTSTFHLSEHPAQTALVTPQGLVFDEVKLVLEEK
ncbi:MAG: hypothetical protein J1F60_07025 [Oscillospiraceae bacterium]|nr:hypothetical protein [Oscillospiraceae bacterium]